MSKKELIDTISQYTGTSKTKLKRLDIEELFQIYFELLEK